MADTDPRPPAEQTVYAAVLADLASRDRGSEAVAVFREPTDPAATVIAEAMIRGGTVRAEGVKTAVASNLALPYAAR